MPAVKLKTERLKELLADKAVSQQNYDDTAASLKQTQAEIKYWKAAVDTARINLGYCRITAPISGHIGKSNITEGAIITAYQPVALATIQQLDIIYVDIPQSSTELLLLKQRLKTGINHYDTKQNNVRLILDNGSAYPLEGKFQFRDVTIDPTTGSVILRAIFPNPESILLPGMFVKAIIIEGVSEQAILVPQQGVSRDRKGNPFSLIVNTAGKVEQQMLTLDKAIGNQWLVSSGLSSGDQVIVEGLQKVRPGAAVKAVLLEKNKTGPGSDSGDGVQPQKHKGGGA